MSPISQMRELGPAGPPPTHTLLTSFPSYGLWDTSFLSIYTKKAWLSENLLET